MLTTADRRAIETRLLQEREEALAALDKFDDEFDQSLLDESSEMSVYRFHMADIGTEAMEREKHFLLASKEGERLYGIDEALRRLYSDPENFGKCTRCGAEIGVERLLVVPAVEHCAACQRDLEG